MARLPCAALAGLVILCVAGTLHSGDKKDKTPPADGKVSFYRDVRPIFQQHCQGCHQPAQDKGGYVMTSYADLFKKGGQDKHGVVAGDPAKSFLVEQITPQNGKPPSMPRGKDPLTDRQVTLIKTWITQGAKDDTPASARELVIDMEHPPTYVLPPVIAALDYSSDGKYLAIAGYHEVLVLKADKTGELVARLVGMSERIQSLAFSPDGKLLAVTGGSPGRFGEVQIWDHERKRLRLSVPVSFDTVFGVSWSPDGTRVAFGCADNSLRAIEIKKGAQVLFQGGHGDWVLDTTFSKDGSHLISVSRDRSMKLTEVGTARLVDNITSITPGALKGGLISVMSHPKEDHVVCGGADGSPKLYQIYRTKARKINDDFNLIRKYQELPGRVYTVKFNKDGSRILAGSSHSGKGYVRIYDTNTAKVIADITRETGGVFSAAFHPNGNEVAVTGFDGAVHIHDANTGKLLRNLNPFPKTEQKSAQAK